MQRLMGPLSTAFDFTTFGILIWGFSATAEVFRTAWFVESMATQILVIFLIRTTLPAFRSRPSRILVATSLGALAAAFVLALSPLGSHLGFVPLDWMLLAALVAIVAGYLLFAERLKGRAFGAP